MGATHLETLIVVRYETFGSRGSLSVCTVVRGVGVPEIAVHARQLGERQLGDGSRDDRSDQSELNELHTDGPGEPDSGRGETALNEKREKTDE